MRIGTYQNIIVVRIRHAPPPTTSAHAALPQVDADGTDGTKKRSIAIQVMGDAA